MHTFKDPAGNSWPLTINLYAVEKTLAVHKVDLPGLFDGKMDSLVDLLGDDFKLCAIVYDLGREENEQAGRSLDDLKRVWGGETADLAQEAFLEELIDFFRDPERRKRLRKLVAKLKELGNAALNQSTADLEANGSGGRVEAGEGLGAKVRRLCWEYGGALQLDPRPFTFRQLTVMTQALLDKEWDATAAILAALYNCAMGSKGRFTPAQFHPSARRKRVAKLSPKESLDFLGRFSRN